MKNTILHKIMTGLICLAFVACGEDKEDKPDSSGSSDASVIDCKGTIGDPVVTAPTDTTEEPDEGTTPTTTTTPPADTGDYYDLVQTAAPTTRQVPGNQIKLNYNGSYLSLCELLQLEKSQLLLFHLVTAKCFDCLDSARTVGAKTQADGLKHVLVFSDSSAYITDDDLTDMRQNLIPDSFATRDDTGVFTKFFSITDEWTPTVIAMNESAIGFYVQNPQAEEVTLLDWANEKLGTSLSAPKSE
jgi:hypothetical protein